MTSLAEALQELRAHPGVQHVLVLGADGLLIQHLGEPDLDVETVAAMIPGITAACRALGEAGGQGEFSTAVIEFGRGVCVALELSDEVLVALLLSPGTGFAPLLRVLRTRRADLAAAV
jgi:predicted regulator of Ras-like GTPase activity (Roadblock/LC7/MglB family)